MHKIEILMSVVSIVASLVFITLAVGVEFAVVVLIMGCLLFLDGLRRE